eukprot:tig00020911_g15743.t1
MFDPSVSDAAPPGLGPVGRLDLAGKPTYTFYSAPHIASKKISEALFADMMWEMAMGDGSGAEDFGAELRAVGRVQLLDLAGSVEELPRPLEEIVTGRVPELDGLSPGALAGTVGRYRQTLLHFALLMDNREAARALVRAGAPLACEDAYGLTPALLAGLKRLDLAADLGVAPGEAPALAAARGDILDCSAAEAAAMARAPAWELGPLRLYDRGAGRVEEVPPGRLEALLSARAGFEVRLTSRSVATRSYVRHVAVNALRPRRHNAAHPPEALERARAGRDDPAALALALVSEAVGYGLFALRAFGAGEFVCSYPGEVKERSAGRASDVYTFRTLVAGVVVDAAAARGLGALANHSGAPNAEALSWFEGGLPRVALLACRHIAPGEQARPRAPSSSFSFIFARPDGPGPPQVLIDYTGGAGDGVGDGGDREEPGGGTRAFAEGAAPLPIAPESEDGWPARIPAAHLPPP